MVRKIFDIFLMFVFLFFCFLGVAYSANYADIEIDVSSDGLVSIDGVSNYAQFLKVESVAYYTFKDGENWVFNLTTEEDFDEYVFRLNLPENAQINYVRAPQGFRIENNGGKISIVGFAENQKFDLVVQYKIDYMSSSFDKDLLIIFLSGMLVFMVVVSWVLLIKLNDLRRRKEKKDDVKNDVVEKEEIQVNVYDMDMFTPRQQEIIKILEDNKRVTQKELEEAMNIPKSSVSRNVRTLEIKGIVVKERVGQANYIFLKKVK